MLPNTESCLLMRDTNVIKDEMKIICVGRNYLAHAKELKNELPEEPVIFLKPDSSILTRNKDFYIPSVSENIHYEVEIVIKICSLGKNIQEKFAGKYYNEIGIGIDFTARDIQDKLKSKGLPWTLAKGFDGAAPISDFVNISGFKDINNLNFKLLKNGGEVQSGNTSLMIFNFDFVIAFISKYFTLKTGDLIFTGTPSGVGPVKKGDRLEAYIENQKMLVCNVK